MRGKLFAEFMQRRGRKVFEGAGSHWYEVERRMIMALPYHEVAQPSKEALLELLGRTGNLGARYLTTAGTGLEGGLYVRAQVSLRGDDRSQKVQEPAAALPGKVCGSRSRKRRTALPGFSD